MTRVRVAGFSVSIDGFGAGLDQSLEDPLGKRGEELHEWFFGTKSFRAMTGEADGSEGVDEQFAARSMAGFGAFILGRNMFGPIRGEWDSDWRGWWGDDPPYHAPVFVLTNHAREPIEMDGGTTFRFVTDGFDAALAQAKGAAGEMDVDIAGGASAVRQALASGALDVLILDIVPVILGRGESIFTGLDSLELEPTEVVHSPYATHVTYRVGR
jgi:dihydrofolate reductase